MKTHLYLHYTFVLCVYEFKKTIIRVDSIPIMSMSMIMINFLYSIYFRVDQDLNSTLLSIH